MALRLTLWLVAAVAVIAQNLVDLPPLPSGYTAPGLPAGPPLLAPEYMVDNTANTFNVVPDKGTLEKPVTNPEERERFRKQTKRPATNPTESGQDKPAEQKRHEPVSRPQRDKRQGGSYWIQDITHGQMPFAPSGYQFFRNVKDFGAVGDGVSDDTEAINRAASHFSQTDDTERCGKDCGQTTTLGAVVYFPPGTYLITSPIIQYYYTQFIGDAGNRPTIKGAFDFAGIALIDCDPYIPGGDGANWFINQNQFFRQIRNFRFDLTAMNRTNWDGDQEYAPTGIHWQVSQAASLQHLHFEMPVSDANGATTAVGIFMENGSGGFLSDLTFFGGNIGFRAGSQQYTARNLQFTSCLTAISMIWDWGFTWQNIYVYSCWVAIDCTSVGGIGNQGTGSITVLDSHFNGVPYPITLRNGGPHPNIVLDNLLVENSASIVLVSGGETIFEGSSGQTYFTSWALGSRCSSKDGTCSFETGLLNPAPKKPSSLLDGTGNIFARSKPTYTNFGPGSFVIVTDKGAKNDATGDQSGAINDALREAASAGQPVFFPAGVYLVESTIFIPVGSIIIGEAWSQIMGTGSFFADEQNPKPVIRVGNVGDSGVIEISDMMWTVKGATAGAILMEWNVHESTKGSAAMWDSHFRVGGAVGSDLRLDDCPKSTSEVNKDCMAASMLFHVTSRASGYFENVWVWTADHDMDVPHRYIEDGNTTTSAQINIFTARGTLIESEGPTWLYGTGSEHHVLYQYQIQDARDIFLTHIQTETPYYQASPNALQPFRVGLWAGDPEFGDCSENYCKEAWGLRIISSSNVLLYTAGLYSFFQSYEQGCLDTESCQERIFETSYSEGLWFYNIFTKASVQVITPRGGIRPLFQSATDQTGFTTEVSAWLVLALDGGDLGGDGGNAEDGSDVVYIDPLIFVTPSPTVQCWPPCSLVFPPSTMPSVSTIEFDPVETSIVVGGSTITRVTVSAITTTVISYYNHPVDLHETSFTFALTPKLKPAPVTTTVNGVTTVITLPAFSTSVTESDPTTFYSLPTTVVVTGGITWTYSMDQITSLRSNTAQTSSTSTKTLEDDDDDDDDDDVIIFPFWINPGGFYWSPVFPTPPPTLTPPRIPAPPVPTVPCFKLFGIFSIMCPPDKTKPTSHFTTGPPKPTCTSGCGEVDNDDDDDDEESSTCATATATECHDVCRTDPCERVCNTYVGCSCPTQTATDYWVSCSSESCTTTRTRVVTGCYETGSATTTGDYCPLGTLNPAEDQGEDGTARPPTTAVITRPPVVIIGTEIYTVTSGSIYVSGSWFGVPTGASGPVTTTVNGQTAVVYPSTTGRGVIVTPTSPGPTPPSNPGPTTTTTTTTTAGGGGGGGGGGNPAPSPTAYMEIAFGQKWPSNVLFPDNRWWFYARPYGESYGVCDAFTTFFAGRGIDLGDPPFPPGTFELPELFGSEGCVYEGTEDAPGSLTCPDLTQAVQCFPVIGERICYDINAPIQFVFRVRCEWGSAVGRLPSSPSPSPPAATADGGCGFSTNDKGEWVVEDCPYRVTPTPSL